MAAGQIVWDLLMKTGSFITDTQRAEKQLRGLRKAAVDFKTVFAGSFASAALTELISQLSQVPGKFSDLVRDAGKFQDVGERIGDSAENVAGFATALAVAGNDVNQLADFSVKLTKNLSKIDEEGEGAAKALGAIGLRLADFKKLNPSEQIDALSKALAGFASGPEQAAVLEALVKGGSQLLPFLKELEQQGGRQNLLTAEQIRLADEYADRQARTAAQLKATAQVIAINMLPALTDLQLAAKETVAAFFGINIEAGKLDGAGVQDFADKLADALAFVVDSGQGVVRVFQSIGTAYGAAAAIVVETAKGNFSIARQIAQEAQTDIAGILDADLFSARLQKIRDARNALSTTGDFARGDRAAPKPRIDTSGLITDSGADQAAKKLLDNQIKALEAVIKREGDLLSERNRFLNLYNDQGLLSIRAYYETQQAIIDAATSAQVAAYNKQLDALEAARQAAKKPAEVADLTGKIDDVITKRAEAEQKAGADALALTFKRQQEEKRYADQIESTRASVLELTGDLAGAAAIRFDLQNAELFKRALVEGDERALSLLQTLRKATIAQADYAKASKDTQAITDALALQEDRIAISRQLGATTELEALQRLGEARSAAVKQLEAMVVAQEAIARASGNTELIQQAERARVALEQLKATADPLGDKFRSIFTDGLAGPLEEFIAGTISAKDAFNAFAANVVAGISRIVAQNLAQSLFGNASSGIGSLIGTIVGAFGGAKATGGDVMPGRSYWVGEQGPERFIPRTAGTILPASESAAMSGGRPLRVTNNFNISGPTDRRSEAQIAAAAGQGVQRAVERHT